MNGIRGGNICQLPTWSPLKQLAHTSNDIDGNLAGTSQSPWLVLQWRLYKWHSEDVLSSIEFWTSIPNRRWTYFQLCQNRKSHKQTKYHLWEKLYNLRISCKRFEQISASIFKKWSNLKRMCVMSIIWELDCAKNNILFKVSFNQGNLQDQHIVPLPTRKLLCFEFVMQKDIFWS